MRLPAVVGAVPVKVAMPEEFKATVVVAEPTVKSTLPEGVTKPLEGETVAVKA